MSLSFSLSSFVSRLSRLLSSSLCSFAPFSFLSVSPIGHSRVGDAVGVYYSLNPWVAYDSCSLPLSHPHTHTYTHTHKASLSSLLLVQLLQLLFASLTVPFVTGSLASQVGAWDTLKRQMSCNSQANKQPAKRAFCSLWPAAGGFFSSQLSRALQMQTGLKIGASPVARSSSTHRERSIRGGKKNK